MGRWLGVRAWWIFLGMVIGAGSLFAAESPVERIEGETVLPHICIATGGQEISKLAEIKASFFMYRDSIDHLPHGETAPTVEQWLPIEIKKRGFSSSLYAKKQYTLSFLDEQNKNRQLAMLGLSAGKKWVLNGPYVDRTQVRNALVYQWGRQLGRDRHTWFAPETRFVELTVEGDYKGIYAITQRIERSKTRVDLPKIDFAHPEATPYFMMKVESFNGPVHTKAHTKLDWVYPTNGDMEELTQENPQQAKAVQKSIVDQLDHFEAVLKSDDFDHPELGYRPLIDMDSFVDYMVIQEVTKNTDAYRKSLYLHKGADGQIYLGPLWDFDLALGNLWFYGQNKTSGWNFKRTSFFHGNTAVFWFKRLMKDPYFAKAFVARYQQLRQQMFSDSKVDADIDALTRAMPRSAIERNQHRWRHMFNPLFRIVMNRPPFPGKFDRNVLMMKEWMHRRLAWLDSNI